MQDMWLVVWWHSGDVEFAKEDFHLVLVSFRARKSEHNTV